MYDRFKINLILIILSILFIGLSICCGGILAINAKVDRLQKNTLTCMGVFKETLDVIEGVTLEEKEKLKIIAHYEKRFLVDFKDAVEREKKEAKENERLGSVTK